MRPSPSSIPSGRDYGSNHQLLLYSSSRVDGYALPREEASKVLNASVQLIATDCTGSRRQLGAYSSSSAVMELTGGAPDLERGGDGRMEDELVCDVSPADGDSRVSSDEVNVEERLTSRRSAFADGLLDVAGAEACSRSLCSWPDGRIGRIAGGVEGAQLRNPDHRQKSSPPVDVSLQMLPARRFQQVHRDRRYRLAQRLYRILKGTDGDDAVVKTQ